MSDKRCCSGGQRPLLSGDRGVEQQLVDPPHHPHRQHDLLLQRGPQCLYQVGNINFRKASEKWKTKNTVYSIDCVSGLPCLAKEMKDLKHILFDFKIHVWSCGSGVRYQFVWDQAPYHIHFGSLLQIKESIRLGCWQ